MGWDDDIFFSYLPLKNIKMTLTTTYEDRILVLYTYSTTLHIFYVVFVYNIY